MRCPDLKMEEAAKIESARLLDRDNGGPFRIGKSSKGRAGIATRIGELLAYVSSHLGQPRLAL